MIIEKGKIKECTDAELFAYWLKRYTEIMSYSEFKYRCMAAGTRVIENETN